MRALTYLIYIIIWEAATLGVCTYLVFWQGYSGWWYLLAVGLSWCAYKPENWHFTNLDKP